MRTLLLLAAMLAAAAGIFVVAGLPAIAQMHRAHTDLLRREGEVARLLARETPVSGAELQAATADRDLAARSAAARFMALTSGAVVPPRAGVDVELAKSHLGALGPDDRLTMAVKAQAAGSPEADAALAAIVRALSGNDGVVIEALSLKNEGRLAPLPGIARLREMEAQLVLTAATPEALACLEALVPERGAGLPILTVESCSLRRIEPERWGSPLQQFTGPPVRLSVSLAVVFPQPGGS